MPRARWRPSRPSRFLRADGDGLAGDVLRTTPPPDVRVLNQRDGVQFDPRVAACDTPQAGEASRRRGGSTAAQRSLNAQCFTSPAALHDQTAGLRPTGDELGGVCAGEVERFSLGIANSGRMRLKHSSMSASEAEREVDRRFFPVNHPFVHAPEVAMAQGDVQLVDQAGDKRGCSVGPMGPQMPVGSFSVACARRDVFEGLCQIELLRVS